MSEALIVLFVLNLISCVLFFINYRILDANQKRELEHDKYVVNVIGNIIATIRDTDERLTKLVKVSIEAHKWSGRANNERLRDIKSLSKRIKQNGRKLRGCRTQIQVRKVRQAC